jgi:hypothetical protein
MAQPIKYGSSRVEGDKVIVQGTGEQKVTGFLVPVGKDGMPDPRHRILAGKLATDKNRGGEWLLVFSNFKYDENSAVRYLFRVRGRYPHKLKKKVQPLTDPNDVDCCIIELKGTFPKK